MPRDSSAGESPAEPQPAIIAVDFFRTIGLKCFSLTQEKGRGVEHEYL